MKSVIHLAITRQVKNKMEFEGTVGEWIKQRRKALDLTQVELGDKVSCSAEYIRKIEQGTRRPSKDIALLLVDALHLTIEQRDKFIVAVRNLPDNKAPESISPPAVAVPTRIPVRLVGREPELAQIGRMLTDPDCRLLTIFGPGGIGKTELALAVAKEQAPHFRDGVATAMLASVQSTALFPVGLTDALGIPLYGENDPITEAINFLREKQLLFVLDNFEHLLDAAEVITRILAIALEVKIIVTSRERLKLTDEWVIALQGLTYPSDGETVLESQGAVELFCRYARRMMPGFTLADNAVTVGTICQQVRGMPLAIEMAASWLHYMSCQEIAQHIDQNRLSLSSTHRDVPSRHRSIKAVFDQSWQLLSTTEQHTMMMLSVFASEFDTEAAIEVAEISKDTLLTLTDKALLYRVDQNRFDIHPLIRQEARKYLLESRLEDPAKSRHLKYFWKQSVQFHFLSNNGDVLLSMQYFKKNADEFRIALTYSLSEQANPKLGTQIAINLYYVWQFGRIPEAMYWLVDLQATVEALNNSSIYADWLWSAGGTAWFAGDNETTYRYIRTAIEVHIASNGTNEAAYAGYLHSLGWVQKTLRLYTEAEASFRESADLAQKVGANAILWAYCVSRANEGELALFRGDIERASWCLQQLETVQLSKTNYFSMAFINMLRGQLALANNNYSEAKANFGEVILWRTHWPAINFTALFLNYTAEAALRVREFDDAIQSFDEVKGLTHELGNLNGSAYACYNMAYAACQKGDYEYARQLLGENLNYNESINHFSGMVIDLAGFAELSIHEARFDLAAKLIGFVKQHYKPVYNTIFSLRHVDPEAFVARLNDSINGVPLDTLLLEGSSLTQRETVRLVMQPSTSN